MSRHHLTSPLLVLAVAACSDSSGPTPGAFRAQLSGVRNAALSGIAVAERSFAEPHPDHHFAIRMHATSGDTVHTIVFRCRGDAAPAAGTHSLSLAGEDCVANYIRVVTTSNGSPILLDGAEAVSGQLTTEPLDGDQLRGTFSFSGPLLEDGDTLGTLRASGSFSADQL